jgi:hypothetical protein
MFNMVFGSLFLVLILKGEDLLRILNFNKFVIAMWIYNCLLHIINLNIQTYYIIPHIVHHMTSNIESYNL